MINFRSKVIVLFFAACFALSVKSGYCSNSIIAVVNDDIITQKDLDDFLNYMRVQFSESLSGEKLESKVQSMKLDLLDKLIEDRLILQEAKKMNVFVENGLVESKIGEIRKRYSNEDEFQVALKKQGLVPADLENRIREQAMMRRIVDFKIKKSIIIRPQEVTRFYEDNIDEMMSPEEREVDSITIDNENIYLQAMVDLKAGKDFYEVAGIYSLGVNSLKAVKGVELKQEIEDLIFGLPEQGVSEPIKLNEVYYIFKVNKIIPPKNRSLDELKERIYNILFESKMQEELVLWLDKLKSQSYIKIIES